MNCQPVNQGIQRPKPKRISLNQGNQPITIAMQQWSNERVKLVQRHHDNIITTSAHD